MRHAFKIQCFNNIDVGPPPWDLACSQTSVCIFMMRVISLLYLVQYLKCQLHFVLNIYKSAVI